jgi:hypothetical protein
VFGRSSVVFDVKPSKQDWDARAERLIGSADHQ